MSAGLGAHLASSGGLVAAILMFFYFAWSYARASSGRIALAASFCTMMWLAHHRLQGANGLDCLLEVLCYAAWTAVALRVLNVGPLRVARPLPDLPKPLLALTLAGYGLLLLGLGASELGLLPAWPDTLHSASKLLVSGLSLAIVEQIARNTRADHRWHLRFLSLGLGLLFGYAVLTYSLLLLPGAPGSTLLDGQPLIVAVAAPFIVIASHRNRRQRLTVNVSRRFVFRSAVLVLCTAYVVTLLVVAGVARAAGISLPAAAELVLLVVGVLIVPIAFGSSRVRDRLSALLARHLYEQKYDYREEWDRVTRALLQADPDDTLPTRVVRTLAESIHATGGALWRFNRAGLLVPQATYRADWPADLPLEHGQALRSALISREFIIDLQAANPPPALTATVTDLRTRLPGARLAIPLRVEEQLFGLAVLRQPTVPLTLIWEDFQLLLNIARQAAGVLALRQADSEVQSALQLRALHQSSAFMVHDLKTVVAQLRLLLENAQKHRGNPAFIDDMLQTTENATQRMGKLLTQLQAPADQDASLFDLSDLVQDVLQGFGGLSPRPRYVDRTRDALVLGDQDRLRTAIGHIVQNAIEATPAEGEVRLYQAADAGWVTLRVQDTGPGMDEQFIERRLFQPFESTKGLTGMGMGAYQSREILRAMGGELTLHSHPGQGSEFVLHLPLAQAAAHG